MQPHTHFSNSVLHTLPPIQPYTHFSDSALHTRLLEHSEQNYTRRTYRLITSVRGGLVALIFTRSIDLDAYTAKASAAVTLMSTDIDGLAGGLQKIHDIWASFIELGLGIYLLQRQIGSACFLVLIPAVCKLMPLISWPTTQS